MDRQENSWCNYFDSDKSVQKRKTKFTEKNEKSW